MKKSAKIITGIVVVGVLALLIVPRFLKPAETADPAQPPVVQAEAPQTGSITPVSYTHLDVYKRQILL